MNKKYITNRTMPKSLVAIAVALILTACSSGLDGTYTDGMVNLNFVSSDKVIISSGKAETELKYEVDGDKVKIEVPEKGNQILTRQKDGTLKGMGVAFTKKELR